MRRITLITAIALVFGMMTASAVSAETGPRSDEAGQRDAVQEQEQEQERERVREHDQACGSTDAISDCDPVRTQTRDRERTETLERDGECLSGDCNPVRSQSRDRERTETHERDGVCLSGDCEPVRTQSRDQERQEALESLWQRLTGGSDWDGQYRSLARWMWQLISRPFLAASFIE
jgi:hypothetical protein